MAIAGLVVAATLAVGVYRAKLGAQETEGRIDEMRAGIARTQEEIAVLRAEEAYLSRPERIGPLARERLGLEPVAPVQFAPVDSLSGRVSPPPGEAPADPGDFQ
jgi:cell division protein FtsL